MEFDFLRHDDGLIAGDAKGLRERFPRTNDDVPVTVTELLQELGYGVGLRSWSITNSSEDHIMDLGALDSPCGEADEWWTDITGPDSNRTLWSAIYNRAAELNDRAYSAYQLRNEVVHATRALDADEVSKLFKLFKGWSEFAETSVAHAVIAPQNVFVSNAFVGNAVSYISGDSAQWLRGWSVKALPTLLAALDTTEFTELVRAVKHEKTLARLVHLQPPVRRLKTQLARLANAIIPHAPPAAHLSRHCGCPT